MEFIFDLFIHHSIEEFELITNMGSSFCFGNFFQVENFKIDGSGQKPKWYKMGSHLATFTIGHAFTNKMHMIFEISVEN